MKNTIARFLLMLTGLLLGGCVYTDISVPMSRDFRNTRVVTKKGEATCRSVLWLAA